MNYYGLPCPVCGEIMKNGDDIVVCPECATPHHRECWFKDGRCANHALHGDGFVWSASKQKSEPKETTEIPENENPQNDNITPDSVLCHICGSENPADALHCGSCGALFGETAEEEKKDCPFCGASNPVNAVRCSGCGNFLSHNAESAFFKNIGIDESEKIGDYSSADYALYTQLNAKRYLPKFRKIKEKKMTFNWAAFFLGPQWFLFRKMYKTGIILMVVFASITMMCTPLSNRLFAVIEELSVQMEIPIDSYSSIVRIINSLSEAQAADFWSAAAVPMIVLFAVSVAQALLCALLADRLYFKKINSDLKLIDETVENEGVRKIMIARRGSASFLAFIAGTLGQDALLSLFIVSADTLSSLF